MSNELGFQWLVCIFDFNTWKKLQNWMWLLICNGHDCYISPKFVVHCIKNNICLFLLLPHFLYLLQLLYMGIFSLLNTAVLVDLDRLIRVGIAQLKKVEQVKSYIRARPNAFTEKNIRTKWQHSELAPTNRHKHHNISSSESSNSSTPQPTIDSAMPSISTFEDLL